LKVGGGGEQDGITPAVQVDEMQPSLYNPATTISGHVIIHNILFMSCSI
jgi:hypothetical protein